MLKTRRENKSPVQVIARAAAILRALESEPLGLSLGQLSQRVGLARSTVQRIVAALANDKLLIAASPIGGIRLGPAILRLATSMRMDFPAMIRSFLVQLSGELGETVDLFIVKRDQIVLVEQITGSQRLRAVSALGDSFPLYCTAAGKAYLAQFDEPAIERLIGSTYEPRTPHTLVGISELVADLKKVRKVGVAFDREEHTVGISTAGVVFRDLQGNCLSISVPVPSLRFAAYQRLIVQRLLATRDSIQKLITTDCG